MNSCEKYMALAIKEARAAAECGDVPVGAVIVKDGEIIAASHNTREYAHNAAAHAEINAIEEASGKLGRWRLSDCEMYVTLEPCPMCAGAIINSRIKRVVFGAKDAKAGAFGSVIDLNSYPLNHKAECVSGVCEKECREILSDFFKSRREKQN